MTTSCPFSFPSLTPFFGFHARQGCEKLLKALITAHRKHYPNTHNLERLAISLEECGEVLPRLPFDLFSLAPFAVQHRYDIGATLDERERAAIFESVVVLREHVVARILQIEAKSNPDCG